MTVKWNAFVFSSSWLQSWEQSDNMSCSVGLVKNTPYQSFQIVYLINPDLCEKRVLYVFSSHAIQRLPEFISPSNWTIFNNTVTPPPARQYQFLPVGMSRRHCDSSPIVTGLLYPYHCCPLGNPMSLPRLSHAILSPNPFPSRSQVC